MIVLNKSGADDTNALGFAHEIQSKLKDGATFSEMASIYSQGSQQHQGGDWGWVERSVLRKELADVAFSLPVGQTSDIINTPDAVYLSCSWRIKRPRNPSTLADVREGDREKRSAPRNRRACRNSGLTVSRKEKTRASSATSK